MSITANLLEDNCSSLDGWSIEELGDWDIDNGFHFVGVENSGAVYKEITSTGDQITIEFKLIIDDIGTGGLEVIFTTNAASAFLCFYPDGIYEGSTETKFCDLDLTENIWRAQYDSTAQTLQLFQNGVSQGIVSGVDAFGPFNLIAFDGKTGSEGHILSIKAGDGLGDFAGATTYTVTYDGNGNTGGSVPTDENTYEEDEEVTVLGNTGNLVKTGYVFAGWNTAADGSGTDYAPAATFQMPASNTTLYAQWAESGDKIQLKNISLIKPALEKISLTTPCLIKSK